MKDAIYHFEFGIHSNIPVCCVEFYIGDYDQFSNDVRQEYRKMVGLKQKWNYIPCPDCAKSDNKIVLHECTVLCIPFLRRIGATKWCIIDKINYTRRLREMKGVKRWNKEKLDYWLQV